MSKKKGEQVLQIEIDTSEQWNTVINKEGLVVTDVYQDWCGHAKQFESIFKKCKVELSDPLLNFAIANADKIPELESYRGKCEPCFLFYASGNLVEVIRGANAPVIIKTITEQLAYEHKCLKGEAQRKPITDSYIVKKKAEDDAKSARLEREKSAKSQAAKPSTLCIIKPDVLRAGKEDELIEKIQEKGYSIIEQKKLTFTEKMVHDFYAHRKEEENFLELVMYMTSGPSIVLALSRGSSDVVQDWRMDLGCVEMEDMNKEDTLRAQYGTNELENALHGSDSRESASKELAFFFPKGLGVSKSESQRTLALIRPSALNNHKDSIIQKIKESGFKIAMSRTIQLEKADAEEFYSEQNGQPFFDDLVNEMTSGPVMVLCLVKDDAVASWRNILGPKDKESLKDASGTLRADFDVPDCPVNALHGASTPGQAEKELSKFFPMQQTVALLKPGLTDEQKAEITKRIEDSGYLIASKKSEKLTEEIAKEMYKNSADKEFYADLVNLMTSGETDIMVLSRENAIEGWREEIGDVDPAKAKETNPESLRGQFGTDVLNNGLHGPTTPEQAQHELSLFFPDTKFNEQG